ncbi:MAG: NTP transferase domain-containing protein [Bacteroidetes bacterium]|nr:NTP transferase domain-containing protein [Bacteroidota bacterium]MCW5897234.1 NTP transferase domain-containing protein [Bacteroidota bacterium]
MAGGFGTRLRPLTCNTPKPMAPVMNKPMMHHIVELLKHHGISEMISTLYYSPEAITNYFGDGSRLGVKMSYVKAEADYGTAGSVRNATKGIDERILVISGDVLTDFDLSAAIRYHEAKNAKATIVLTHATNPLAFGVVITAEDGKITRFLEKPSWGEVFSDTINTGIYILEPDVMELIPYREEFDFSKNLFPHLFRNDLGLYGYIAEGYWRDIGNLNEYQEAHTDALNGIVNINIEGKKEGNLRYGEGCSFQREKLSITGHVVLGKNVTIGDDVALSNCVIGDNCVIGPGAVLRNTVIWNDVVVGHSTELSTDVVCSRCSIGEKAVIAENVFIGDACWIGRKAQLSSNIKLWPEKVVEEGAILTRSLVWEDKWLRELFADARVTGLSNIEMNPEFGAKLGAAYGAFIGEGRTAVTCRDSDNVSRMMNRALICGLVSAGVNTMDLRAMSIPLLRHELSTGKEAGGIHVRRSPFDKNLTDIIFFDANGKDLPSGKTKNIERLFFGEDFPRATRDKVGSIFFPERTTESYREKFISSINMDAINKRKFNMVIDYSNGVASTIFPIILGSFDCQVIATNAHLDPKRLTRDQYEFDNSIRQLSHIVTSLRYDIGCLIDAGGEKIFLVNENGEAIHTDRLLTIVTELFLQTNPDATAIAVPITSSGDIDIICGQRNVSVLKTRNSHLAMMEAATTKQVQFVGGNKGGFIFTDFFFATDAMYSFARILMMMAMTGKRLGDIDAALPRMYMSRRNVNCSWEHKGRVMRQIMRDSEGKQRDLVDGVKVHLQHNGQRASVLLLPDKERPLFHINAEAPDKSVADDLANQYERKIIHWRDKS